MTHTENRTPALKAGVAAEGAAAAEGPTVTVLICTSGRGDSIVPTVRTVLAAHGASRCDELLVVDQSTDDRTEEAVAPFRGDPRLRYVRVRTRGKGVALNFGLEQARGEIVAITDDDCEVTSDWLAAHKEAFRRHPRVVLTYGQVLPVEHDPEQGFIPVYYLQADRHVRRLSDKLAARGIGANTALRPGPVLALGGFDPALGPGGALGGCVDGDITVRCLLAGHEAYETAASRVYHYGFRNWEQGRKLTVSAWRGLGASCAKPLRAGRWATLSIPAYELTRHAVLPFLWSCLRLRPRGLLRITSFWQGFARGWRTPLDRERLVYRA